MFDIGFWELSLILVVALLVIGPERLPGAARVTGMWIGRARRMFNSVKADIDRELRADEMKKMLEEQIKVPEFQEIKEFQEELQRDVASETPPAAESETKTETEKGSHDRAE